MYKLTVRVFDHDYHYSPGWTEETSNTVSSWEEAVAVCKELDDRPYSYSIEYLWCLDTGENLWSRNEYDKFLEKNIKE